MKKRILLTAICAVAFVSAGAGTVLQTENVNAETATPTVAIYAQTLALEENIHIKYAVATENVSESAESGLLVWREAQKTYEYGMQDTLITVSYETLEEEENEYPVYAFTELSAKEMVDAVYAVAYVKEDGEYYYSPVKKYSILEYAYNMLGKTEAEGTDEENLKSLLNAMLAYGGAAQTYFEYKTETLASDEFSYVRIENATFADGFSYGLFEAGTEVFVTPDEGYELSATAAEYLTTDEAGEIVLTVPTEKTVDTTSFVIPSQGSQGLAYTLNSDKDSYSVTGIGTCTDTELVIPSKYKGLSVTNISSRAFKGCNNLTSIVIPNSIETMGDYAFSSCSNLKSATIGSNVWKIGASAFFDCGNLMEVTILEGVNSIGENVFKNCSNLIDVTIPSSVTSIGNGVFYGCSALQNLTLPEGIKSIANETFYGCVALSNIKIPESVLSIGSNAFYNCSALSTVTIPNKVKSIGFEAFYGCANLSELTIGDSVTSIGNMAFGRCQKLMSLTIPDSVTSIEYGAFSNCYNLENLTIGNGITELPMGLFALCSSLKEVVIPKNVTRIGSAFQDCTALESVLILGAVTNIGDYAFYNCSSLKIVYYNGTEEKWANVTIGSNNTPLTNATVYYYSENEPAVNEEGTAYDGNYWHYNTDGVTPVVWVKTEE